MKPHRIALLVMALGMGGGALVARPQAAPGGSTLSAIEADLEKLHKQTTDSLVRVRVTQSAAAVLDSRPGLKAAFDDYTKSLNSNTQTGPGAAGPGGGRGTGGGGGGFSGRGGEGRGADGRGPGRSEASAFGRGGPAGGGPGGPGGISQQVRSFLSQRATTLEKSSNKADRDEAAILRGLALRVEVNRGVFQGEMSAILFDDQKHALLLTGLLREAHLTGDTMRVTLPDHSTTTARFVGANLYTNYTVIQLASTTGMKPIKLAGKKLHAGQLLLSTTAGNGATSLVLTASRPGEAFSAEHLVLPAEDRAGGFLVNVDGELAAIMPAGGGFGDRAALNATRLKREIDFIMQDPKGRDIEPGSLGLKFEAVAATATMPRTVRISDVAKNSLAEAAKLQKGDILVSIDGRPISELVSSNNTETPGMIQLKVDLVTRTEAVPLVVRRGSSDITLSMPLK